MKLIVIRGPAGCGKTEIANRLAATLKAEVLHVDWLKTALRQADADATWPEIRSRAYVLAVERLQESEKTGVVAVVLEELLTDASFVRALQEFCVANGVEARWFRIRRPMEEMLAVENSSERTARPVRNSREDLEEMERGLDATAVSGEVVIENDASIAAAVERIKSALV